MTDYVVFVSYLYLIAWLSTVFTMTVYKVTAPSVATGTAIAFFFMLVWVVPGFAATMPFNDYATYVLVVVGAELFKIIYGVVLWAVYCHDERKRYLRTLQIPVASAE